MTYYYNGKPYVQDIDMYRKHFVAMANGQVHPDANGNYHIRHTHSIREKPSIPLIKVVTPIAQAIEMAKSELALETKVYKGRTTFRNTTSKKTVAGKKSFAKKTVTKNKSVTKKKVSKKKTVAKRTVAKKKSIAKKTVAKKKSVAKKAVTKKKTDSRKPRIIQIEDVFGKNGYP
jgi:hypothetical protein